MRSQKAHRKLKAHCSSSPARDTRIANQILLVKETKKEKREDFKKEVYGTKRKERHGFPKGYNLVLCASMRSLAAKGF